MVLRESSSCKNSFIVADHSNRVYSNYNLGGYLSERIASLTALQGLYLDRNQLRGPIPTINLLNLQWLHLENNQFSGEIPDLGNCKDLTDIFLQNNELTGTVPVSFGRLPKLTQLFLQNNTLVGDLPFKSSVPNSTYQFAPQRSPPAASPGQAQGTSLFLYLPRLIILHRSYKFQSNHSTCTIIISGIISGSVWGFLGI